MENKPIHKTVQPHDPPAPASLPGQKKVDREKLKKACTDFEALFMTRILRAMRQTVPPGGFLGNSPGKEIYQGLMDQELAKSMSRRGGIGLGEMLYRQVIQREEKSQSVPREGPPGVKPEAQEQEDR